MKPSSFIIACGDGAESVSDIHWSSWGKNSAMGTGTYSEIVCQPNCAGGHALTTTIPIVLSNPAKTATGYRFSTMILNAGRDDPETVNILK